MAAQDDILINQLIALALGEKIAALKTEAYLRERGQGASADDLAAILALVPDAEPEERDRFSSSIIK